MSGNFVYPIPIAQKEQLSSKAYLALAETEMSICKSWKFCQSMILDDKDENDITVYDFIQISNPNKDVEEPEEEESSDEENKIEVIEGIHLVEQKRRGYKRFGELEGG
eukprot:328654-Ditylum_brightwellii.AAC.1